MTICQRNGPRGRCRRQHLLVDDKNARRCSCALSRRVESTMSQGGRGAWIVRLRMRLWVPVSSSVTLSPLRSCPIRTPQPSIHTALVCPCLCLPVQSRTLRRLLNHGPTSVALSRIICPRVPEGRLIGWFGHFINNMRAAAKEARMGPRTCETQLSA